MVDLIYLEEMTLAFTLCVVNCLPLLSYLYKDYKRDKYRTRQDIKPNRARGPTGTKPDRAQGPTEHRTQQDINPAGRRGQCKHYRR